MKIMTVLLREIAAVSLRRRLGHQSRLQSDVRVAHIAFQLGSGHQRGDRVDDDDVDRIAARQHLGDLQRLFAGVGLRNEQVVEVDAERRRVVGIERMLDVDEGRGSTRLLGLGDRVQRERRLAARLGTVDLDDSPARKPADPQSQIERDRAGRNDFERHAFLEIAHPHDRAFPELPLDLRQRIVESELPFVFCCHVGSFLYLPSITLSRLGAKGMAFFLKERVDEFGGSERAQVVGPLAQPDELDRHLQRVDDRDENAAFCR